MFPGSFDEQGDLDEIVHSPSSTLCATSPALHMFPPPRSLLRLEINTSDTCPFSDSFSGLITAETNKPQSHIPHTNPDASYDIERFTDLKEIVSEWDDEDVDEILVISPKLPRKLATIEEESIRNDKVVSLVDFEPLNTSLTTANNPKIRLCRKRDTGRIYALSTFSESGERDSSERVVLGVINDLKASFLPKIFWSFWDENVFSMVMDYYPRKNLHALISSGGSLNPPHALFYASEIVQAISVLHAAGIIHRDLRPEHVMMDTDGHIVLVGFEFSEILRHPSRVRGCVVQPFCTTTVCGGTAFQAPEITLGWSHDFAVDCWGFGMILYFMLSGAHPFAGAKFDSEKDTKNKIVNLPITLSSVLECSTRDLITKCLERNPSGRLSLPGIRRHSYFSSIDWKKVSAKQTTVPRLFDQAADLGVLGADARDELNKIAICQSIHDRRHARTLSRVSNLDNRSSVTLPNPVTAATSKRSEHLQALPKIFRMSSLLDDLPESTEETPSEALPTDPAVYSALTLNDLPQDTRMVEVNSRDRMAMFWESLDTERVSISPVPSLDYTDSAFRPRKLRKSRSSVYPQQRISTFSTYSLQNKLRKKSRPQSTLQLDTKKDSTSTLDLPTGVKQIGSGIGFSYTNPVATRSKASICTNVPQTCHGIFQGGLPGLGFGRGLGLGLGLRSGTRSSKTKTGRGSLRSSRVSASNEGQEGGFSRHFGGSSWSLVMPMSPPVLNIERMDSPTVGSTSTNSPVSEIGLLTPATLVFDGPEPVIDLGEEKGVFKDGVTHEMKNGEGEMTLRLVTPSRIEEGSLTSSYFDSPSVPGGGWTLEAC